VLLFRAANGEKKTMKYDVTKIRSGELDDPILVNEDVVVVNRSGARTALRDSLFRDIIDTINPFSYMRPAP
jgi:polysaccharide export outer membrane protein